MRRVVAFLAAAALFAGCGVSSDPAPAVRVDPSFAALPEF